MIKQKSHNIRNILALWKSNTLTTSCWLKSKGISRFLITYYLKSKWLKSEGRGVYSRLDDKVEWPGVVYALQQDNPGTYHVGARSALQLAGLAHFIPMKPNKPFVFLFSEPPYYAKTAPKWLKEVMKNRADFLIVSKKIFVKNSMGLETISVMNIPLLVSSPERAILELLAIAPQKDTISNANYIMQGMGQIRHKLMQQLLENCTHKAAKRLFLHFAEKYNLPVFESIDISKMDLGTGRIQIEKGSHFDSKYNISVPDTEEESIANV